ncbi:MAG: hypothetical protein JWO48_3600 [Bryobacterales bacterium]|nr:hypothetical protein [Bryobacterales bacterium]
MRSSGFHRDGVLEPADGQDEVLARFLCGLECDLLSYVLETLASYGNLVLACRQRSEVVVTCRIRFRTPFHVGRLTAHRDLCAGHDRTGGVADKAGQGRVIHLRDNGRECQKIDESHASRIHKYTSDEKCSAYASKRVLRIHFATNKDP